MNRDLSSILDMADATTSLDEQVEWLNSLLEWVRLPVDVAKEKRKGPIQAARLKFLLQFLDRHPNYKEKVNDVFQSILIQSKPLELFCETGLSQEHGFIRELFDRLVSNYFPHYSDPGDLSELFARVFKNIEDGDWIEYLDEETTNKILGLLLNDESAKKTVAAKMSDAMTDAILILAARASAVSVSQEMRERLPNKALTESPFFLLHASLIEYRESIVKGDLSAESLQKVLQHISQCREVVRAVHNVLEQSGVSVDLVYNLERASASLARIETLLILRFRSGGEVLIRTKTLKFVADLIRSRFINSSVTSLIGSNLNLIARKIVDRTGMTGEHYITRTSKEYRQMFFSAGGGGVLTVGTTLLKALISKSGLPLFFEGFFTGLNYAASFVTMQFLHFTLATKTPSMTAAALAEKIKSLKSAQELSGFVDEVACLSRSTFIAAVGNVGLVVPGALLFDYLYKLSFGTSVFTETSGLYYLEAHNPFTSMTLFYAAFTGVILWTGSVAGGWVENWFVYRRIGLMIKNGTKSRRLLGAVGAVQLAERLHKNIAGLATNIALGFLLAFTTVFGNFFGAPLDVRHVTLSSGTLAFSVSALNSVSENLWTVGFAIFGILVIGCLNFGVSFTLSLFVASRAKGLRLTQFPFLLKIVAEDFSKNTRKYFFPPRSQNKPST